MLSLPPGIYGFTISNGAPASESREHSNLPAINVGLAPVQAEAQVFFYSGPKTLDRWLVFAGDQIIAHVVGDSARLMVTSLRRPDDPVLGVHVRRLDVPLPVEDASDAGQTQSAPPTVMAHMRKLGDLYFPAESVGPIGPEFWIEAFWIDATAPDGGALLEYRALGADEIDTPWHSNTELCGSRGCDAPLLGFAVRPCDDYADTHECTYFGYFRSGRRVGPIKDGGLCRSDKPDDPLEGIELQVVARA
jgi:hypothetical protein